MNVVNPESHEKMSVFCGEKLNLLDDFMDQVGFARNEADGFSLDTPEENMLFQYFANEPTGREGKPMKANIKIPFDFPRLSTAELTLELDTPNVKLTLHPVPLTVANVKSCQEKLADIYAAVYNLTF